MTSPRMTLILVSTLFLALTVTTQGKEIGLAKSCEDRRVSESWSQEEYNLCLTQHSNNNIQFESLPEPQAKTAKKGSKLKKAAKGLAVGVIVAIVLGTIFCCCLPIGLAVYCLCFKNRE